MASSTFLFMVVISSMSMFEAILQASDAGMLMMMEPEVSPVRPMIAETS